MVAGGPMSSYLNARFQKYLKTGPHQKRNHQHWAGWLGSVDDLQLACSYRIHFAVKPSLRRAARLRDFAGRRKHSRPGPRRLLFRDNFLAANQGSWAEEWTASQQRTIDHFFSECRAQTEFEVWVLTRGRWQVV